MYKARVANAANRGCTDRYLACIDAIVELEASACTETPHQGVAAARAGAPRRSRSRPFRGTAPTRTGALRQGIVLARATAARRGRIRPRQGRVRLRQSVPRPRSAAFVLAASACARARPSCVRVVASFDRTRVASACSGPRPPASWPCWPTPWSRPLAPGAARGAGRAIVVHGYTYICCNSDDRLTLAVELATIVLGCSWCREGCLHRHTHKVFDDLSQQRQHTRN
jgi:hypothetical protein